MLNFLKQSKKFLSATEPVCFVIGNESCDLDSAVSAVSLAYLYQESCGGHKKAFKNYLPILNIQRGDYALKTEVKFMFNSFEIREENLTFRDDLSKEALHCNANILVDHHVNPLSKRTVEVYDHRPLDASVDLPQQCEIHRELVGSCATLIGEKFLQQIGKVEYDIMAYELLRSTIILDTVNFSKEAARATVKDEQICQALEKEILKKRQLAERGEIFRCLVKARADVSSLTANQLLRKDLKIISNTSKKLTVALPGFPMLCHEFINLPNAQEAIEQFALETESDIVLLLGMFVEQSTGQVQRDLGLITMNEEKAGATAQAILQAILDSTEPNMDLAPYQACRFMRGHFYIQNNIKATRKHLLPIVRNTLGNS